MIANYHLFCFTFWLEPGISFKMGYSLTIVVLAIIAANFAVMGVNVVRRCRT